jgi:hypothetical protein
MSPSGRPLGNVAHPLLGAPPTDILLLPAFIYRHAVPAAPAAQGLADQATLETRQPEVQWSEAGSTAWQTVDSQQTVSAGDRVRTGTGASARLIYFDGTVMEIAASTGLLVERLERTETGNIVARFFQSAGTTISRVVQLVDPTGGFEIETPAATAFVRGTMPRVEVAANGTTVVTNVPDNTGGLVNVAGKDPATSLVVLLAGQETRIVPGQPPAPAAPQGTFSAAAGLSEPDAGPSQAQQQRQQQRQQQQQLAEQQVAQAQAGLAAAEAEAQSLARQAVALEQQIGALIGATVTPGVSSQPPSGVFIAPIPAGQVVPCARGPRQVCTSTLVSALGSLISGSARGVQTGPQTWTVTLSGLLPGTVAAVVLQTTRGFETLPCPVAPPVGPTICQGTTLGVGLEGGAILVLVNTGIVAQGTIAGTNQTVGTLTATAVGTATPTASTTPSTSAAPATATPTVTLIASPTGTATGTGTLTGRPSPTMTETAPIPGTATPTSPTIPTLTVTITTTPSSPTSTPEPLVPTATATLALTTTPTGTASPTPTAAPTATASPTVTATADPTPTTIPTATATRTVTTTPTGTASPTPTATGSPTPTATLLPTTACVPSGAVCRAQVGPPGEPMAGGFIAAGLCPTPGTLNCLQFTSTGAGVTVGGVITGAGGRSVIVNLPVVDETGTPQENPQTMTCSPLPTLPAGQAACPPMLPEVGVFPQLGGFVTVSRSASE